MEAAAIMSATWWRGGVIYQIYPRSFKDTNGDGIGDLPGITQQLPYVASLGVDAIWISPFFPSPMRDFGYDVSGFCDVDPMFGTLSDFDELVRVAHERGLKVIIDQVYSHTSDRHPWFAESRSSRDNDKADWYVWADPKPDGSPPNNWQSVFVGSAWTWDARRGQYYLHNFLTEQPDLNLLNPRVHDALLDAARFWLDRGVDGFRVDAVSHFVHDPLLRDNPPSTKPGTRSRPFDFQEPRYTVDRPETLAFLERLRQVLNQYPDRFALGELGGPGVGGSEDGRYVAETRLQSAYSFFFLRSAAPTPQLIQQAFTEWENGHGDGWPTWVFSNHDAPRVVTRWGGDEADRRYAQLMLALLFALRGSVCLYQGEELGLPQAHVPFERLVDPEAIANWPLTLGRDGARTPLPWTTHAPHAGFGAAEPWLPVDPRHAAMAVDLQERDSHSSLQLTRQLLDIRHRFAALREGDVRVMADDPSVLMLERAAASARIWCVFNLTADAVQRPLPSGPWRPLAGNASAVDSVLSLPPYGYAWLIASSSGSVQA
jgi:alpha-glucosidase